MKSRIVSLASVIAVFATTALSGAAIGQLSGTFTNWLDHPAIAYNSTPPKDPVTQLNERVQQGRVHLEFDGPSGYLRSVLEALSVPVESQIAVFAKDSVQRARISLGNPRTLFFNDSVAVGWVRGGFIELAAQDPQQGVVFYVLDRTLLGQPRLTRRNDCLTCHFSYSTAGVPGMLARSAGQFTVDHTLALEKRWGGWFVTGSHGSIRHLGNSDLERALETPAPTNTLNWPSLAGKFDTTGYLSTHSDIAALLVFEHQMHLMNLLSRMGWEARVADHQERTGTRDKQGEALIPVAEAANEVVDYLLFVNEAPLTGNIRGSSGFAERFAVQGPRDGKGRSLRELDLHRRLMRYPCSYMIYSPVFNELPRRAKEAIYRRMWSVLSGDDKDARYRTLAPADRKAIVEILLDTKPDLPDYFRSTVH